MLEDSLWTNWWSDADMVIRAVFVILITLSVLGWSVLSYKVVHYLSVLRMEKKVRQHLMQEEGISATKLIGLIPQSAPTYPFLASCSTRKRGMGYEHSKIELDTRAEQFLEEKRINLENGLIILAIIGNSAPFIGLLGTVWGIMHALQSLGGNSMLTMDMVAGPVSEALVATAVGLFAAIPAAAAYNLLVRWLRRISSVMAGNLREMSDVVLFSEEANHGRSS